MECVESMAGDSLGLLGSSSVSNNMRRCREEMGIKRSENVG